MELRQIQRMMKGFGILSLSKKTGIARSYLYKIAEGSSSPTLEYLDLILKAMGFKMEIVRMPTVDSVADVTEKVANDGQWKIHYFNFVDAFRKTKNMDLVVNPPYEGLCERDYALIASIVFQMCLDYNLETPEWAKEQHILKDPWFVAGVENLKAMSIVESPLAFKRNNIFVLDNFLSRT